MNWHHHMAQDTAHNTWHWWINVVMQWVQALHNVSQQECVTWRPNPDENPLCQICILNAAAKGKSLSINWLYMKARTLLRQESQTVKISCYFPIFISPNGHSNCFSSKTCCWAETPQKNQEGCYFALMTLLLSYGHLWPLKQKEVIKW